MNRPFNLPAARTPLSGGKLAGVAVPSRESVAAPAISIGAAVPCGSSNSTGRTGAPNPPTVSKITCRECDGAGEAEYMALDETSYSVQDCHKCDGSGLEKPYCEMCEGPLTAGYCRDCDFPSGWLLAERSAFAMPGTRK